MSEMITKVGPERCQMVRPEQGKPEHKWLGRFARGSWMIQTLLANGWTIMEDDRNHLVNDYGQDSKEKKSAVIGLDPVKTETVNPVKFQEKRKRGRPAKLK